MRKNSVKGWVRLHCVTTLMCNAQLCPWEAERPLAPVVGCLSPIGLAFLSWTWGVQSMDEVIFRWVLFYNLQGRPHELLVLLWGVWHVGTRECYQVTSNTRPSQSPLEHSDQLSSSGPSRQSGVTWSLKYYHSDIMLGPFSENSIQFTHKKVASYKTFQYFQCLNFVSIDNLVWFQYCHLCYRCY